MICQEVSVTSILPRSPPLFFAKPPQSFLLILTGVFLHVCL
nr:MAG TPA: hypothetical protein [Caudoviricetes sp.]